MTQPASWTGVAFNQATESENKIHADDVARRYGFRGGLVPGVTVYAYLVQPAVESWGVDWLSRGVSDVVLRRPVYDGDEFRVEIDREGDRAYRGRVLDPDGTLCAEGRVALDADVPPAAKRRNALPAPAPEDRPEATREALEALRAGGLGAVQLEWRPDGPYGRYTRELDPMPALLRPDGGCIANPAFTLGLANAALAANVRLGPWIHVQSEVQNHAAIPSDSRLVVESSVADLFERGGHEFVDLDVCVFIAPATPALTVRHRAIYRLHEA